MSGRMHAQTYAVGMQMRRRVLGAEHMDPSLGQVTGLAERMQVPHALAERAVELWAEIADALLSCPDHTETTRWVQQVAGQTERAR